MAILGIRSAPTGWPLVGRREELDRITESLRDPGAGGVLICGPPGVGKSRLAEEVLAWATAEGRTTGCATASTATAAVPLGALVHLLPREVTATGFDPLVLFDRVSDAFGRTRQRYVLWVDDLQLLDPTSLALISQLADARVIFLIATVRTDEPVPDAVSDLWRGDRMMRIDLTPLTRESVDTLLHLALGGPVAGDLAADLWAASRGNVLFLRELVQGVATNGTLADDHGVWRITGPLVSTDRLTELIGLRLATADAGASPLLEVLALCEPVGLSEILSLSDASAVEDLERSGLVNVQTDGKRQALTLAHPLFGEVLRARMPSLRRRRILLEAIARVESTRLRRRGDALRIATWRLEAVGTADPELLTCAARLARYGHDFAHVAQLCRAALHQQDSAEVSLLLGEALYELGQFAEAEELLAAAETQPDDERQLVQISATRIRNMLWGLHRAEDALAVNRAAQERVRSNDARNELLADEATLLMFSGRPRDALAVVERLGTDTDLRTRVVRAIPEAVALRMVGRSESSLLVATKGFEDHHELGDQLAIANPGSHLVNQVGALQDSGRLAEALELATAGYEMAVHYRSPIGRIWFCACKGYALQVSGFARSAQACYSEAVTLCREYGYLAHLRFIITGLAVTSAWLGDSAAARAAMAESARLPALGMFEDADREFGTAWVIVAESGDLPRAREVLLAAAALAQSTGHRMSEISLLHDVVRLGDAVRVKDRIVQLAGECEGSLVAAFAQHAVAASADDGQGLAEAAGLFEEMGAVLMAAEAAAEASRAFARAGERRKATMWEVRAGQLVARCEGARTPALMTAAGAPLTRREREIASLAATGLASRDIAVRLHLSVRTVDNHLQNAYTKLGVAGRGELAAALDPSGQQLPPRADRVDGEPARVACGPVPASVLRGLDALR